MVSKKFLKVKAKLKNSKIHYILLMCVSESNLSN